MIIPTLLAFGGAAPAATEAPSLEGRFVMTLSVATRVRVPVLGWLPSRTVTTVLVDLSPRPGGGYVQRHQVCGIDIDSDGRKARTIIPPSFIAALPIKRYPVEIGSDAQGWTYAADLGMDHLGYDASLSDDVPRRPRDPAVTDPDGDGKPGMTVLITVPILGDGELYVAQRGKMSLEGRITSADVVEGALSVPMLEQQTLKATHPLMGFSPPIEPVPGESWFRIKRTPDASCADARLASR